MAEAPQKVTVYQVMSRILAQLSNTLETSRTKATLANLRNSIGRDLSQTVDVWQDVFDLLPIEFLSTSGIPTKEENAIFAALQLYALHQQGSSESVDLSTAKAKTVDENETDNADTEIKNKWLNIGNSLGNLRSDDNLSSMDKRFNAMITSATWPEMITHLRHLIRILKAKANVKVNYARLADDLFWVQNQRKEQIRLQWGQSYYGTKIKNNEDSKGE